MEFSRQEYWSGWPFLSPEDLPQPRDWTWVSCVAGIFWCLICARHILASQPPGPRCMTNMLVDIYPLPFQVLTCCSSLFSDIIEYLFHVTQSGTVIKVIAAERESQSPFQFSFPISKYRWEQVFIDFKLPLGHRVKQEWDICLICLLGSLNGLNGNLWLLLHNFTTHQDVRFTDTSFKGNILNLNCFKFVQTVISWFKA